jgi:predicted RNA polymerase sigma factor
VGWLGLARSGLASLVELADLALAVASDAGNCLVKLRRNGTSEEAAKSYLRALSLVTNDREREYLERRLREVQSLKS